MCGGFRPAGTCNSEYLTRDVFVRYQIFEAKNNANLKLSCNGKEYRFIEFLMEKFDGIAIYIEGGRRIGRDRNTRPINVVIGI